MNDTEADSTYFVVNDQPFTHIEPICELHSAVSLAALAVS